MTLPRDGLILSCGAPDHILSYRIGPLESTARWMLVCGAEKKASGAHVGVAERE